jgi:hypothetical protein
MRQRPHFHACDDCGAKTECPGTYEPNYDGWPEVVCSEVDVAGHPVVCDDCVALRLAASLREVAEELER